MADNSKRTGAAVEAHYQFLAWLVPTIEKFPKSRMLMIEDRIETIAPSRASSNTEVEAYAVTRAGLQGLRKGALPGCLSKPSYTI
jgi:hypothetical protein